MARENWHLDKSVPISIIIVLIAYVIGAIWFAATMDSRVTYNARNIDRVESESLRRIERMEAIQQRGMDDIRTSLQRIEDKLDRKADK